MTEKGNQVSSQVITKLEQQKRNKNRFNVFIDGQYALSVHEDVLVSLGLIRGKQVNQQEIEEILLVEEEKKIERATYHYLSYRPRTVAEVSRYLLEKGYQIALIEGTINHFVQKGYLNDETFAKQWLTERVRTKRKGYLLLREELKQKGISSSIIAQVMAELEPEAEWQACYELALKKLKTYHRFDGQERTYKLKQYLARRGFSFELIQSVCREIIEDEES